MPRRVADYANIYGDWNLVISVFAFILGFVQLVFLYNLVWSYFKGRPSGGNPWEATTLEWQTPDTPPKHGPLGPKDNAEVLGALQGYTDEYLAKVAERRAINDELAAIREKVKARSVDLDAWRAALAQRKLNPNRRESFDRDVALCRKAFDMPIQPALFEAPAKEEAPAAPAAAGSRKKH